MKKMNVRLAVVVILSFSAGLTYAQNVERDLTSIMILLGVDTAEALDEDEVEQFSAFLDSPLEINLATRSKLVASGLFTQYQAASLVDYRERHGDVLSLSELAVVDGFSEEFVRALRPFISVASPAAGGARAGSGAGSAAGSASGGVKVSNELTIRAAGRTVDGEEDYNYGAKYRFTLNDRFQIGLSANRAYGSEDASPEGGSFYLAYYGRKQLGKLVLGDFRLRYGQGLALWSGSFMTSLSSPESFYRRPSGVSPYWSFSGEGSYRGLAADINLGRVTVSTSLAFNGLREKMQGEKDEKLSLMPALNLSWYGRNAQVGVTGYCTTREFGSSGASTATRAAVLTRTTVLTRAAEDAGDDPITDAGCSVDFRWCLRGTDIFGEAATDLINMKVTAVLGTVFTVAEPLKIALRGGYSEDEYDFAAGGSFSAGESVQLPGKTGFGSTVKRHTGSFSIAGSWFPDAKYGDTGPDYQVKMYFNYSYQVLPALAIVLRLAQRQRSAGEKSKTDLRLDLKYAAGDWAATIRFNGLYNTDFAMLSYIEGGWKPSGKLSMYLRAGIFKIDNWADRIYVYERDAPGNFNVPAYYGRGCWAAFTAGFRATKWCRIYARLSTLQYPWVSPTASSRPAKTEAKILLALSL